MKTLLVILSLVLGLPSLLKARIGESPSQCIARYGEPNITNKEKETLIFKKEGFALMCEFRLSKCVMILFFKEEKDALNKPVAMSETEITTLLEANSGGLRWSRVDRPGPDQSFRTEDGKLLASYAFLQRALGIITKDESDRRDAEEAKAQKEKLKGF